MKIIIVGAGFTGTQLAKRLIQEKNDVVLIDRNEDIVRHVSNRLDCLVIPGNGNNLAALKEAGIAKADALVMLTESDEVNMITCSLVDSVYPDVIKKEIPIFKEYCGSEPVLLLDDVLSELDSNRQNYLLNSIGDIQTLITCTGLDEFINNRFEIDKIFKVTDGVISSEN